MKSIISLPRQRRRDKQAAAGTRGPVSAGAGENSAEPCLTQNIEVQGVSANDSKPGRGCISKAGVKGERGSRVSQFRTDSSCGTRGAS